MNIDDLGIRPCKLHSLSLLVKGLILSTVKTYPRLIGEGYQVARRTKGGTSVYKPRKSIEVLCATLQTLQ